MLPTVLHCITNYTSRSTILTSLRTSEMQITYNAVPDWDSDLFLNTTAMTKQTTMPVPLGRNYIYHHLLQALMPLHWSNATQALPRLTPISIVSNPYGCRTLRITFHRQQSNWPEFKRGSTSRQGQRESFR